MTDELGWERCVVHVNGGLCTGVRFEEHGVCIAHLEPSGLDMVLGRIKTNHPWQFLRGVTVDEQLLEQLVQAGRRNGALRHVDATRATFTGDAKFGAVKFQDTASFRGAVFKGVATFVQSTFVGEANFGAVTFEQGAQFGKTTFEGKAIFKAAQFTEERAASPPATHFGDARFCGPAVFLNAHFGDVTFKDAHFEKVANLQHVKSDETLGFEEATFEAAVDVSHAQCGNLTLKSAVLQAHTRWDNVCARQDIDLSSATFEKRFEASSFVCERVFASRATWQAGAQIDVLGHADIYLDHASFAQPSLLTSPVGGARSSGVPQEASEAAQPTAPRLISVRGANLEKLTISGIDMSACRFVDGHNLDELRLEGQERFAWTPPGPRWTNRIAIAEEHKWRRSYERGRRVRGWYGADTKPHQADLERGTRFAGQNLLDLDPTRIKEIYRALRKARENAGDEPGAADFYYGEMEMRRAAARERMRKQDTASLRKRASGTAESVTLTLYWLVSGYGLRAWRAFALLAGLILVCSVLFAAWGIPAGTFGPDLGCAGRWAHGLLVSLQSATSLVRPSTQPMTVAGEWLMLYLRYAGPILLALAALALRARVKR